MTFVVACSAPMAAVTWAIPAVVGADSGAAATPALADRGRRLSAAAVDVSDGTDPAKTVRSAPLVPIAAMLGDHFSLAPPEARSEGHIYLPAIQR